MQLHKPSIKLVNRLAQKQKMPAVSIIMPTHPTSSPDHLSEDRTRFKNLYNQILRMADEQELYYQDRNKLEQKLFKVYENLDFWRNQLQGLGLFMTLDESVAVQLPQQIEEHVSLGSMFHITPVVMAAQVNAPYFLFQPSYKHPKLFEGDVFDLNELDIELPKDLEDALNIEGYEFEQQFHSFPRRAPGTHAMYHGHGGNEDAQDHERRRYMKILSGMIHDTVSAKDQPLVLAGTADELTLFRTVTPIKNIAKKQVEGSLEGLSKKEIKNRIEPVLEDLVQQKQQQASRKIRQNKKMIFDQTQIVNALKEGRIKELFVGIKGHTADHVQDSLAEETVLSHEEMDSKSIDMTILRTLQQGGEVVGVDRSRIPHHKLMAATLRY